MDEGYERSSDYRGSSDEMFTQKANLFLDFKSLLPWRTWGTRCAIPRVKSRIVHWCNTWGTFWRPFWPPFLHIFLDFNQQPWHTCHSLNKFITIITISCFVFSYLGGLLLTVRRSRFLVWLSVPVSCRSFYYSCRVACVAYNVTMKLFTRCKLWAIIRTSFSESGWK